MTVDTDRPSGEPGSTGRIAAATVPGSVHLTVRDLDRALAFYTRVLGLTATGPAKSAERALGAAGGPPLLVLHGDPDAPDRDPGAPGLFHFALLLPTREDLAGALVRVAQASWPLSGASDHLVSEALYLSDPEGNGIELYRDRPRAQWPRDRSGAVRIDTRALDLRRLASELDPRAPAPDAPAATRIGHVHLQVSDIPRAEAFYAGLLGFDVVTRDYPGALFVSAGGYHHHLGLNTWHSRGAVPGAPGGAGLRRYELVVPDRSELTRVTARLANGGASIRPAPDAADAMLLTDPFGTGILLRCA